ncbi:MAG TPA: DUF4145 domain-containing protein [Methylotenera sp.]|nr:DUF4145 domain-containing protein [Methylotenera sp.]HPV44278.1 DUF4145 domain-containing protein [Methylotenera sp.]
MKYIAPKVHEGSFTCPHCNAISQQTWWSISLDATGYVNHKYGEGALRVGNCTHCTNKTIWLNEKLLYPTTSTAPIANSEMPQNVREIYDEASSIFSASPRAAAALLRLALQILCENLGGKGKNINDDIAALVSKGLPNIVQQSLDIVRVTGNDAVHPGQIDVDSPETVGSLFELINIITEYMVAMPNKVSGIYKKLPANKLQEIENRDANK